MSEHKARQFYELVKRMRKAQKDYFRTRSQADLDKSKKIEKEVDAEIDRAEEILRRRREPRLFD